MSKHWLVVLCIAACSHSTPSKAPSNANTTAAPRRIAMHALSKCAEDCQFSDACMGEATGTSDGEGAGWDDGQLVDRCRHMFSTTPDEDIKQCGAAWQLGRVNCEQQDGHTAADFDACFAPCLTKI